VVALDDWDRLGRDVPCLVNLRPSGQYLMEDFYYAGGLPAVIHELAFKAEGSFAHTHTHAHTHASHTSSSSSQDMCRHVARVARVQG
jgi:dihydroxyacid dehydratase/phosphogluconate dehydratase